MIYLTYNDQPSGIYFSQVIDVIKFCNSIQKKQNIRLVAFISIRSFFSNRKQIKEKLPNSIVIPMAPGAKRWKWNILPLCFIKTVNWSGSIIARGPFASSLALLLKQKGLIKSVIFDARGAYKAELNEYNVVNDEILKSQIANIEQDVLRRCDRILAVSHALVNYWKTEYSFVSEKHVVIPCTISNDFIFDFPKQQEISVLKKEIGFSESDIVFVYSGSAAGWQSFSLIENLLTPIMEKNKNVKLLWLTSDFNESSNFVIKYKSRIKTNWLRPSDVRKYLLAADYGILYRENSITNSVASPVKFAEYLSCGLKIVINNNLGDFSDFVKEHNCGVVGDEQFSVEQVDYKDKVKCHTLAMTYLVKGNFTKQYLSLIE